MGLNLSAGSSVVMMLTFVSGYETKLGPGAPNEKLDHGGKKQKMESAFIPKKNSLPTD